MKVNLGIGREADLVIKSVFESLGCEPWGGASVNGWSKAALFQRCPYAYALQQIRKVHIPRMVFDKTDARDVGSYTHVALAAHYASMLPDARYPGFRKNCPDALSLFDLFLVAGGGAMAVQKARQLFEGYIEHYVNDDFTPVAVEMPIGDPTKHTSRLDTVGFFEEGLFPGLWISEHKTASTQTDVEEWRHHGEILGEVAAWQNDKLDELFGDKLQGVCINILFKGNVPKYQRLFLTFSQEQIDNYMSSRRYWNSAIISFTKLNHWPKALYGCSAKYGKCDFWEHCSTLNDDLLKPIPTK